MLIPAIDQTRQETSANFRKKLTLLALESIPRTGNIVVNGMLKGKRFVSLQFTFN